MAAVPAPILIKQLLFKDDSFRTYNWSATVGSYTSNGDEITINQSSTVVRALTLPISGNTSAIDFRAYAPSSTQLIIGLASSGTTVYSTSFTINNTIYQLFNAGIPNTSINTITLQATNPVTVDFIAIEPNPPVTVNESGIQFETKVTKKTIQLKIPNTFDYIEELGISSRNITLQIGMAQRTSYNQLESWVANNNPVLYITPTLQATGFLQNVQGEVGGAWVPMLYNITAVLIKGDMEIP